MLIITLMLIFFGERLFSEMFIAASIKDLDFSNLHLIENIKLTGRLEVWRISLLIIFKNQYLVGVLVHQIIYYIIVIILV